MKRPVDTLTLRNWSQYKAMKLTKPLCVALNAVIIAANNTMSTR